MKTETRNDQFEPPSILGNVLRKLHIDIPLFIGSQDMDILMRQAGRVGLAFL